MKNTQKRVNEIIDQMCQGKHIDDVTKKWLSQTPNSLRISRLILFCETKRNEIGSDEIKQKE